VAASIVVSPMNLPLIASENTIIGNIVQAARQMVICLPPVGLRGLLSEIPAKAD
jgi:hypothetical protein